MSIEQKIEMRDLLATGMKYQAIADKLDCSKQTVYRMARAGRPVQIQQNVIIQSSPLETKFSQSERFAEAFEASGLIEATTDQLMKAYANLQEAQTAFEEVDHAQARGECLTALAMARVKIAEIIASIPIPAVERLLGKGVDPEADDGDRDLREMIKISRMADGERIGT